MKGARFPLIHALAGIFLGIFALQGVAHLLDKSPTFDEPVHLSAGFSYLTRGDYRMNVEHPPLIKHIAALPLLFFDLSPVEAYPGWEERSEWKYSSYFLALQEDPEGLMRLGRFMILSLSCSMGVLVYFFSRALWGGLGALISLFLFCLDPNLIAHSSLVTTDAGFAFFVLLYLATLMWALQKDDIRRWLVCGAALGLAAASKYSAGALVPVTGLVLLVCAWRNLAVQIPPNPRSLCAPFAGGALVLRAFVRILHLFAVISLVAALVLWGCYGFQWKPYPLAPFVEGLRYLSTHMVGGHPTFLNGEHSNSGFWYYFPEIFLLKTPLPSLLCMGIALAVTLLCPAHRRKIWPLLLFSAVFFFMACFSRIQIGYRHLLPLLPAAFVLCGVLGPALSSISPRSRAALLVVPAVWLALSTGLVAPHYLTYFNELAGGPIRGKRLAVDSNLDWGQDLNGLAEYVKENSIREIYLSYFGRIDPSFYGIPCKLLPSYGLSWRSSYGFDKLNPPPGVYAISATNLMGQYLVDRDTFVWFREREPQAIIGNSIYIYHVN